VKQLGVELGLSLPAIVRNGVAIQDLQTGAVLDHRPIPAAAARAALHVLVRHQLTPIVEEGPQLQDRLFTLPADACHPSVFYYAHLWKRVSHIAHVPDLADLYAISDPNWIGGCGPRSATLAAYADLQAIAGIDASWYGEWQPDDNLHGTGIAPAGCSKASALARFAAQHHIALSEAFAIGDFLNDIEMLREVRWGVAMGHAPDSVKAAANAITEDNAHEGAAQALERYVLGL
jgi:hydroxymethylpyrimidine pyrophosphatase-like HAD family hydrolase